MISEVSSVGSRTKNFSIFLPVFKPFIPAFSVMHPRLALSDVPLQSSWHVSLGQIKLPLCHNLPLDVLVSLYLVFFQ
jgi:hypothetical protein